MNRGTLDLILYAGGYVMWLAGDALFRAKPRERLAAASQRRRALVAKAAEDRREHGPPQLPPGTPRRKPRPELLEPSEKAPPPPTKARLRASAAIMGLWIASITGLRVLAAWDPLPRWSLALAAGAAASALAWLHLRRAYARELAREARPTKDWSQPF